MIALRCPDGHVTESTDYCDVCGLPMSLSAAPPEGAADPGSRGSRRASAPPPPAQPDKNCPNCRAVVPAGDLFCENCGYDFTTGQLPVEPAALAAPGYGPAGYDPRYQAGGYDPRYDQGPGRQPQGYAQGGDQGGYSQGARDQGGYSQGARDQGGYSQGGRGQADHDQGGYDQTAYDQGGYDQSGYDQGYDQGQGHGQQYAHPGAAYDDGYDQGYDQHYDDGQDAGHDDGFPEPAGTLLPPTAPPAGPPPSSPSRPPGGPGGQSTGVPPSARVNGRPPGSPSGPPAGGPPVPPGPPGAFGPSGPVVQPPPAQPAPVRTGTPPGIGAPHTGPVTWVAEVWVDPDWFATQDSEEQCPSSGMPMIVPLWDRSLLIGRVSASRNIHPQIDCGTDHGVSRRHAQLTTDGQRWWIEDLQSSNGTFVGLAGAPLPKLPIPAGARTEFAPGDRIYVGAWTRIVVRHATADEA